MTKLGRFTALVFLSTFALATMLAAQSNPESPKFTLSITAVKSEVAVGADVAIAITITNTSESSISIAYHGHQGTLPDGFEYDVRDEKGTPVSKIGKRYVTLPDGRTLQLPNRYPGSVVNGEILIASGKSEEITGNARISEVYPFDHPGKYTIQASRKVPGMPLVKSNTIAITVVAPESPGDTVK